MRNCPVECSESDRLLSNRLPASSLKFSYLMVQKSSLWPVIWGQAAVCAGRYTSWLFVHAGTAGFGCKICRWPDLPIVVKVSLSYGGLLH